MPKEQSGRDIRFGSIVVTRQGMEKDAPLRRWVVTDVEPPGFESHVFFAYGIIETEERPSFWSSATLDDHEVIAVEKTLSPREVLSGIARGFRLYNYPFKKEYRTSIQSSIDKSPRTLAARGKVKRISFKKG